MLKIVKTIFFVALLCIMRINAYSQSAQDTYFESKYGRLEYGLFIPPNYDSLKSYPLVMFLHGWSNNYSVYLNFYNGDIQRKNPCFVYSPKTPVEWGDWSSWSWEGTTFSSLSEPTKTAIHVLDSLTTVYSIDTNRLYVYGISMGGEGVFDLLHKMPDKFAAGISICGGGFPHWAENIANTPFWMFHGSADNINPPDITERVYKRLVEIGAAKMRYTNYPGYGHEIWDKAQSEPSFYDWMFAFSKNNNECEPPQGNIILEGTIANKMILQWNNLRDENIASNTIWYYNIYNSKGLKATVEYDETNYSFTPDNKIDTFRIEAINYCFAKSELSNPIYYNQGKITTSLPVVNDKKKVEILKNKDFISIDVVEKDDFPVTVQLSTFEGKILHHKTYESTDRINLNLSKYNMHFYIVTVLFKNECYTEKLLID